MRALAWLAAAACLACARPPAERPVHGIASVAFLVSDVDKARAFYVDLLGFTSRPPAAEGVTVIDIASGQTIELRAGPAGRDGRLERVRLYGDAASRLIDPDGHALEIVPAPAGPLDRTLAPGKIATHIAHVGILVGGLAAAKRFYEGQLRMRETWRGSSGGRVLDWVNLATSGGEYLELMLYDRLPPPEERGGKHHVCLFTPDIAQAVATLEARPARREYARPIEIKVGKNRKRQANLFDPDGTRVELMEPHTIDGQPTPPSPAPPPRP
jgi:lactoylglutathione lyase